MAGREDDTASRVAQEKMIEQFGRFIEDWQGEVETLGEWQSQLNVAENIGGTAVLPMAAKEELTLVELTHCDNKMVTKVALAFLALVEEMSRLDEEAVKELLPPLLVYTEGGPTSLGKILAHLQHISCFLSHCRDVLTNLVQQLAVLLDPKARPVSLSSVRLAPIWEATARLLAVLAKLEVAVGNEALQADWKAYKRMVKGLRHTTETYGVPVEDVRRLEKLLLDLEKEVVAGGLVVSVVTIKVEASKPVHDELAGAIRGILDQERDKAVGLPGAFGLAALLQQLTRQQDKKLGSRLWDSAKRLPGGAIVWENGLLWRPELFLNQLSDPDGASSQEKKQQAALEAARKTWVNGRLAALSGEAKALKTTVAGWVAGIGSKLLETSNGDLQLAEIGERVDLIATGTALAQSGVHSLASTLSLFQGLEQPLTRSALASLGEVVVEVKRVEKTLKLHRQEIAKLGLAAQQHAQFLILNLIHQAKRGIVSDKKYSEARLDILSCLLLAERATTGPPTPQRLRLCLLAVAMAGAGRGGLKEEEWRGLCEHMTRLSRMMMLAQEAEEASRCDSLASHLHLLPLLLGDTYAQRAAANLPLLLSGFQDAARPLSKSLHKAPASLVEDLQVQLENLVEEELVAPLCREIETELRLSVHQAAGLQLDDRNPFRKPPPDLLPFLRLPALSLLGKRVHLRGRVEAYLATTFYNLTTVSLANWKTYGAMRRLAESRLQLDTVPDRLPPQTLEQGLDVLEMMRNIHIFTAGYNYNINTQVFVEQASNNKHLNTINIQHIANSIRTHGAGILNTTVNFTYQFLRKKFAIFSQFLYDEHISSRLVKDLRFFKQNREALGQQYPFDRAVKFNRGIRKLGLMPDGVSTYLDQFRLLVTHMGNALGFVRMVRSGGLRATASAIRFVPDLTDIPAFAELATAEGLGPEAVAAGETLDEALATLAGNFSSSNQYFDLLVQVFSGQVAGGKQPHLANFYLILPPLAVNYIEHLTGAKEKIFKKNLEGACFTEDGFSMGLAYCLTLLNQWREADSLHCVEKTLSEERTKIAGQRAGEKEDSNKQSTQTLTIRRLDTTIREFRLLHFNLTAARAFFQGDTVGEEEDTASISANS